MSCAACSKAWVSLTCSFSESKPLSVIKRRRARLSAKRVVTHWAAAVCYDVSTRLEPGGNPPPCPPQAQVRIWEALPSHRRELEGPEGGPPQPLLSGLGRGSGGARAILWRRSSTRARCDRAATAERWREKRTRERRARAFKSWPLRSFERLSAASPQRGLPAVARARRLGSR